MPRTLTADSFHRALADARDVYAPGCTGHSLLFESWLRQLPAAAAGCRFFGVHIPGCNTFDFAALDPDALFAGPFVSRDWAASWRAGRFQHHPQTYSRCVRWLSATATFDVALLQVAPPDEEGRCSFGLACDFSPAAWPRARRVLAHVNPRMPRTDGPWLPWSAIDAVVHAEAPLLEVAPAPDDAVLDAVAARVAALIPAQATLQLGLGRLQHSVLQALTGRRGLRLHAGMVSDGLLDLLDAGALAADADAVVAGVALGSARLYARAARTVRFAPVSHTHDAAVLARLPSLHAVNSALSVDLLGQVNGETIGGRVISGVGGLPDFMQAAARAPDGRGIVALPSRTGSGRPRIVPLQEGPVSLSRSDVDTVVTEHGAAALADLDADARAQALIALAHPDDRCSLTSAWRDLRKQL